MTDKPKELRRLAAEAVRRYPCMNDAMSWLYRLIVCRTQFDDWRAALVEAEIRPLIEEALRSAPDAPSFTLHESAMAAARGVVENQTAFAAESRDDRRRAGFSPWPTLPASGARRWQRRPRIKARKHDGQD